MKKTIVLLLTLALSLSLFGCGAAQDPENYVPTGDALDDGSGNAPALSAADQAQQELTLIFYRNESMNPYLCSNFTNRALFSLLYQGLFSVDSAYRVQPVLCSRYSCSEDQYRYTFYVDERATFSDGSPVTAEDVAASLNAALESDIYRGRFFYVQSVELEEDGGVSVYLYHAYEDLPLLLDVPILKATQVSSDRPMGTGPYSLVSTITGGRLVRRSNWWCQAELPVDLPYITLVEATSNAQIRDEFEYRDLDLVCADPGSGLYADFRCDYELWDCENGYFLYLACKPDSKVFSYDGVRAALTYAIDRDYLVEAYYRGHARSACLPASPQSPYYNTALANRYRYDPDRFSAAVAAAGMQGATVTMLVNSGDSLRLHAAKEIGKMLEAGGLQVKFLTPDAAAFEETLLYGEYDFYLGMTQLSPNMDLSQFFYIWGSLSYGGLDDDTLYALSLEALANSGNYYNLHRQVMDTGAICPILFRSYAIYATRGSLKTLNPARDAIFYYSIGKSMDDVRVE